MKKVYSKKSRVFLFLKNYVIMFILVSFVVTCSLLLFLSRIDFNAEQIRATYKVTLINVFFITAIVCIIESIVRFVFSELPLRKILDATERLTSGDFSVRIQRPTFASRDMKRLIDSFNRMAQELSGLETLRSDFISNVSHEIKTPLAVIQNYAVMLKSHDLDGETRADYAQKISESSKKLSSLVTNILKLNKLENQSIFPIRDKFNLSEQVRESILEFESIWEEKDITLEIVIEDDILIASDPQLLSLVWNNLLSNAFKFTDRGGRVSVSLTQTEGEISFCVKDNGCGMTQDTGMHIFEKFYQGDTSHATIGNGLGLSLVKRVIDILGAQISVQSTLGVGSEFTVVLYRGD